MWRADSFEKTLMLEKIEGRRRRDDRGWDGWVASPTQWTWVWVFSRSWWGTGRPGMLQFMGLQRVRHNWVTELNWCMCFHHTNLIQRLLFTTFNLKFPLPQLIKWHFPLLETGFHRLPPQAIKPETFNDLPLCHIQMLCMPWHSIPLRIKFHTVLRLYLSLPLSFRKPSNISHSSLFSLSLYDFPVCSQS